MKVWVVTDEFGECEAYSKDVLGVFSERDMAAAFVLALNGVREQAADPKPILYELYPPGKYTGGRWYDIDDDPTLFTADRYGKLDHTFRIAAFTLDG